MSLPTEEVLRNTSAKCDVLEKRLRDTHARVLDLEARLNQSLTHDRDYCEEHKKELDAERTAFIEKAMLQYDSEIEAATKKMCGSFYDQFKATCK